MMQADELLLPLSVLKGGAGGFGKWSRKVARRLDDKARIELEDLLDDIETRWIQVDRRLPLPGRHTVRQDRAGCSMHHLRDAQPHRREIERFRAVDRKILAAEHQTARSLGQPHGKRIRSSKNSKSIPITSSRP